MISDARCGTIPLSPAEILGVADRVGSLDAGKGATLFVADGDELENSSRVLRVSDRDRKADMKDKRVRQYEKYQEKYRQLEQ